MRRRVFGSRVVSSIAVAVVVLATGSLASAAASATTLKVTTTKDELSGHHGKCSLRKAIQTVDSPGTRTACGTARRGPNTIELPAGRYRLSIQPKGADGNATGDLNVTGEGRLTIVGRGKADTVIDAAGLGDRALSIAATASVTLRRLTITGGHPAAAKNGSRGTDDASCSAGDTGGNGSGARSRGQGGGISNSGRLTLDEVAVRGNAAGAGGAGGVGGKGGCTGGNGGPGGDGGGIYNQGRLGVIDSSVWANTAGAGGSGGAGGADSGGTGGTGGRGGPGGDGGGIYNRGKLSVLLSSVYKNRAGRAGAGGSGGGGMIGGAGGGGGLGGSGGAVFSTSGALRVINSTFTDDIAGSGGAGGAPAGSGGAGGDGGAIRVTAAASMLRNATVADNGVGAGGSSGGARGSGGGLSVQSPRAPDDMRLQNTIVASSIGADCAATPASAIANGGHDLGYGDATCPGAHGNPKLGRLNYNGGPTPTMALAPRSPAINRVPKRGAHCPATDQRGVRRPQGNACDIGAFEFAVPQIAIITPRRHGSYERDRRIIARFRCTEGGITSPLATCKGTVPDGRAINTGSVGRKRFTVTAVDKTGNRRKRAVHYAVWAYTNPVREVSRLEPGRIDMGVDYVGSGPILALGNGRVTYASNHDSGPLSCWGRTCWPGGGAVVYRLTAGPFVGKYVYAAENITVTVTVGQTVKMGQRIAILHYGSPFIETGWASGDGPETLAIARGNQCTCTDPGGWSTIEGRNFDQLLVFVGAPSGYLQPNPPDQRMPRGWPRLPRKASAAVIPKSAAPMQEGSPAPRWLVRAL